MGERLKQALIDRGRKIIVVQNPALDLEAEHVTRSRKTVRDEQTSRNFSLFGEPISEAHKIVARKSRPFDLFAHLTIRRIRRATGARRPQIRPFLGPISYPWHVYRDAEWQADTFAGGLLMSSKHLARLGCHQNAAVQCGMTPMAASVMWSKYEKEGFLQ